MFAQLGSTLLQSLIHDEGHPSHFHFDLFGDFILQELRIAGRRPNLNDCFPEVIP
jgi:hypothetical protein